MKYIEVWLNYVCDGFNKAKGSNIKKLRLSMFEEKDSDSDLAMLNSTVKIDPHTNNIP